ncbi:MAG: FAD-binding oxidoreductase [Pseudanabaenaceae cyanobacterium bins.39]|nr:FAD-binding oxidoreductase [Pseudanabaenaceae cyanobacterium bins.39]
MYDWIVIGGGITGISLSYELQKVGFSVLLIEQHQTLQGASSLGYGGIPYWSATTPPTQQLFAEGISRQRELSQELGIDTEFRDLDLLLTFTPDVDPDQVVANYANCAIAPTLLDAKTAGEYEPLLNTAAIGGAVKFPHGHINLDSFVQAHSYGLQKLGGEIIYAKVNNLLRSGDRITGVSTDQGDYHSHQVVVCTGAMTRALLRASGIHVRVYFTHAEAIDIPPSDLQLRTMIMPAICKRMEQEELSDRQDQDPLWDDANSHELAPPSVDAGAIQYLDGRIRLGQLSRVLTDPFAAIDAAQSEAEIRAAVAKILPAIANLSGKWRNCLVSFSSDGLPLVGALQDYENLHVFAGFTSPTVFVPALSPRFAAQAKGNQDEILPLLSPNRFI